MKSITKLTKIDSELKAQKYLEYCLSLSETERIMLLAKLSAEMWTIWRANPENEALIKQLDPNVPKRLQRLSKSLRKI
jgi:hypothetical protein